MEKPQNIRHSEYTEREIILYAFNYSSLPALAMYFFYLFPLGHVKKYIFYMVGAMRPAGIRIISGREFAASSLNKRSNMSKVEFMRNMSQ